MEYQEQVDEVLEKYVEFINHFDGALDYTVASFYEFGDPVVFAPLVFHDGYHKMQQITILASDGDEGGPSLLIGWWEAGFDGVFRLDAVLMRFDTMWDLVWDDDKGFKWEVDDAKASA